MSDDKIPGWGIRLQTEVEQLQAAFKAHQVENRETHKDLYQRTERPSWTLAWVITAMGSALSALIVYVATH